MFSYEIWYFCMSPFLTQPQHAARKTKNVTVFLLSIVQRQCSLMIAFYVVSLWKKSDTVMKYPYLQYWARGPKFNRSNSLESTASWIDPRTKRKCETIWGQYWNFSLEDYTALPLQIATAHLHRELYRLFIGVPGVAVGRRWMERRHVVRRRRRIQPCTCQTRCLSPTLLFHRPWCHSCYAPVLFVW